MIVQKSGALSKIHVSACKFASKIPYDCQIKRKSTLRAKSTRNQNGRGGITKDAHLKGNDEEESMTTRKKTASFDYHEGNKDARLI